MEEHRLVARAIEFVGWVVIALGFIVGVAFGVKTGFFSGHVEGLSWSLVIMAWLSGLISGFGLIGSARLIELLLELQESVRDALKKQ